MIPWFSNWLYKRRRRTFEVLIGMCFRCGYWQGYNARQRGLTYEQGESDANLAWLKHRKAMGWDD